MSTYKDVPLQEHVLKVDDVPLQEHVVKEHVPLYKDVPLQEPVLLEDVPLQEPVLRVDVPVFVLLKIKCLISVDGSGLRFVDFPPELTRRLCSLTPGGTGCFSIYASFL